VKDKVPTLNALRAASGILLVALLFAAGNYLGDWGFFGGAGKAVMSGVAFLLLLFLAIFQPRIEREMHARREAQLEVEREWERTRDKSNDQVESEKLRRAIGISPNSSLERTREE
jgi:hypothetical protein